MIVSFKNLTGNTFRAHLQTKATVADACRSLSRIFNFSDDHIHLISVNDKENKRYYRNEDLILDILRNGSQYIFFMIIPKIDQGSISKKKGVLGRKNRTTRRMKQSFKNEASNFSNIRKQQNKFPYGSILHRDYCKILKSTPRDLQSRINQVAQLGFQIEDIKEALRSAHFNVQLAIDILVSRNNSNNEDRDFRRIRHIHDIGLSRFSAFHNFEDDQYDFIHIGYSGFNNYYDEDSLIRPPSLIRSDHKKKYHPNNDAYNNHNDSFSKNKNTKNRSNQPRDYTKGQSNASANQKNDIDSFIDLPIMDVEPFAFDADDDFSYNHETPISLNRSHANHAFTIEEESNGFEPQTNINSNKQLPNPYQHKYTNHEKRKTPPPKSHHRPPPQTMQRSQLSQDQFTPLRPKHDIVRELRPMNDKYIPDKSNAQKKLVQPPQLINYINAHNNPRDSQAKNQIKVERPTHLQQKQLFSYSKPKQAQSPPPPRPPSPSINNDELIDIDKPAVKIDLVQEEEEDPEIQNQKIDEQNLNSSIRRKALSTRKFRPKVYHVTFEDDE